MGVDTRTDSNNPARARSYYVLWHNHFSCDLLDSANTMYNLHIEICTIKSPYTDFSRARELTRNWSVSNP